MLNLLPMENIFLQPESLSQNTMLFTIVILYKNGRRVGLKGGADAATESFGASVGYSGPDGSNLSLEFNNIKPASNTFFKPIGTSDTLKDNAPAWLLRNMSGSVGFSGSATYNDAMSVPVLTSSVDTVYSVLNFI